VYDLIVTLGSESGAYDDTVPWIGREQRLLRDAFEAGVPVLGICFGSQLLARALGGRAVRAERSEIGWMAIESRDPSIVPGGPWLQWHHDSFTIPAGATLLAHSPAGPQAYAIGRSLGVQFHPEVTPRIVADWVAGSRDELDREGVDPDRLLADSRELDRDNHARAVALFDAFYDRVARRPAVA
jgi:GMP synthase-like glutamine amidotransferase